MPLPSRCCDLVLKGGITSGVVYPEAVREIAKRFHLVGVGGTSAGAIAASLAAAAEYRRRQNPGDFTGFDMVAATANEFSAPGRLKSLIRPDHQTEKLFDHALKLMAGGGKLSLAWKLRTKKKRERYLRPLIENGFGLCTGMANGARTNEPPLTRWLCDKISQIAGVDHPLTFQDLHGAPIPQDFDGHVSPTRSIDFRMMTTSLTLGRPFEFPLETAIFFYDRDEWTRYFPQTVLDALEGAGTTQVGTKIQLPMQDLPIAVAVRMSLSFPVLFAAVPLWAVNYHKSDEPLERVWFSDGGLTSNFPIHRYDRLFPTRPTLGINLQYGKPQRRRLQRTGALIYLIQQRSDAARELFHTIGGSGDAVKDLFSFGGALLSSAKDWHDNSFLRLSAFRDRVVEIWMKEGEGGLNLDMKPEVIKALVLRGLEAGRSLASRFDDDSVDSISWNGHRWARLRATMDALESELASLQDGIDNHRPDDPPVADFFADPPCYDFGSNTASTEAQRYLTQLLELIRNQPRGAFAKRAPSPPVELTIKAPLSR